jgi:hypothetical protein
MRLAPNDRGESITRKAPHEGSQPFAAVRKPQDLQHTLGLPVPNTSGTTQWARRDPHDLMHTR